MKIDEEEGGQDTVRLVRGERGGTSRKRERQGEILPMENV